MSEINTGGRAFPWCGDLNETPSINLGMTLRDYFAAKAMPGIYENLCAMLKEKGQSVPNVYECVALAAYEQADALIRARGAA